jgi:hypothetical protein
VEIKDGVAIIRIDGPGKMNTIDDDFRKEIDALWTVSREGGREGGREGRRKGILAHSAGVAE